MASVNDTSGLKQHLKKLEKYCKVCAKVLQAKETAHLCDGNTELLKTFNDRPKTYTSKGVLPQMPHNSQQDLEWTEGGCG